MVTRSDVARLRYKPRDPAPNVERMMILVTVREASIVDSCHRRNGVAFNL